MFVVDATLEVAPFGTVEELQAEAARFEQVLGLSFLAVEFCMPEALELPAWAHEWGVHLCQWDCWLFEEQPIDTYLAMEDLELAVEG